VISLIWQTYIDLKFLHVAPFNLTCFLQFRLYLFRCKTFSVFWAFGYTWKTWSTVKHPFFIKIVFFFPWHAPPSQWHKHCSPPYPLFHHWLVTTPSVSTTVLSPTTSYHLPKLPPSSKPKPPSPTTLMSLWNCHSLTMAITRDVPFWRLRKTGNPCASYPKRVKDNRGLSR